MRVVEPSACENSSKMRDCASGLMPDAGVADLEAHGDVLRGLLDARDADHHRALLGELDRVADQVGQHLAQAQRVAA